MTQKHPETGNVDRTALLGAALAAVSALTSGVTLALVAVLLNRKKTAAEISNLDAERSKSDAEADTTRLATRRALMELEAKVTPMDAGTSRDAETPLAPFGWLLRGSEPDSYEVGKDRTGGATGTTAYLRAKPQPKGFGTLMQMFKANNYRGTRQALSARIKSEDVGAWAGLWMRVDGPSGDSLAFDNMESRPIEGTTAWTSYKVVLDVPQEATYVALGVLLCGPGSLWIDDLRLDEVGDDVPTTDVQQHYPSGPVNLTFNE
jgi:hypothetical protein